MTTRAYQAKPANLRELRLLSAGQYAGMRNVWIAMARTASSKAMRRQHVKSARDAHHTYLARLREAQDATDGRPVGYYVPPSMAAAPIPCGQQMKVA